LLDARQAAVDMDPEVEKRAEEIKIRRAQEEKDREEELAKQEKIRQKRMKILNEMRLKMKSEGLEARKKSDVILINRERERRVCLINNPA